MNSFQHFFKSELIWRAKSVFSCRLFLFTPMIHFKKSGSSSHKWFTSHRMFGISGSWLLTLLSEQNWFGISGRGQIFNLLLIYLRPLAKVEINSLEDKNNSSATFIIVKKKNVFYIIIFSCTMIPYCCRLISKLRIQANLRRV